MKEIVLAGGCFWGVEEFISRIPGVIDTNVGYANGIKEAPTYKEVCKGATGHTEAVYVQYNEIQVTLEKLLEEYWNIIEPTVLNRQGLDVGHQYRTGIYFIDENDEKIIEESKKREQKKYEATIVTEIEPVRCFYDAEEYHQKYLKKNPGGYCHIKID